jgi:hypothetical protein
MADLRHEDGCYGAFSDAKEKQILTEIEIAQKMKHLPAIARSAP